MLLYLSRTAALDPTAIRQLIPSELSANSMKLVFTWADMENVTTSFVETLNHTIQRAGRRAAERIAGRAAAVLPVKSLFDVVVHFTCFAIIEPSEDVAVSLLATKSTPAAKPITRNRPAVKQIIKAVILVFI